MKFFGVVSVIASLLLITASYGLAIKNENPRELMPWVIGVIGLYFLVVSVIFITVFISNPKK
jgi:hypothetical protein